MLWTLDAPLARALPARCASCCGAVLRRGELIGVRLSREFAAPTQIVVGSELGAAKARPGRVARSTRRYAPSLSHREQYHRPPFERTYRAINADRVILTANSRARASFVEAADFIVVSPHCPNGHGGGTLLDNPIVENRPAPIAQQASRRDGEGRLRSLCALASKTVPRRGERGRHGGSRHIGSGQSDARLIRAALRLGASEESHHRRNCGNEDHGPCPKDLAAVTAMGLIPFSEVCGDRWAPLLCQRIPSVLGGFKPIPSGRQRLRPTIFPFGFAEFLARAKSPAFAVLR